MITAEFQFPSSDALATVLNSIFAGHGSYGPVAISDRTPNVFESSFPSEVVTCQFDDQPTLRLLCKYGTGCAESWHRHRGGVRYEAQVYRQVLKSSKVSTAAFHGDYADSTTGRRWLIIEYLDHSRRVHKIPGTTSMALAARWIGQFHADNDVRLRDTARSFLNTYDAEYYLSCAHRTSQFAGDLHQQFPWLQSLCARFEEVIPLLLPPMLTVIHGEYTPHNILYREGIIYPVDWESAALAVGEIDLAVLTDGWSAETMRECEFEYQKARWPEGPPTIFKQRLRVAHLYTQFRWLSEEPERTTHPEYLWRFDHLRAAGEQLGLI